MKRVRIWLLTILFSFYLLYYPVTALQGSASIKLKAKGDAEKKVRSRVKFSKKTRENVY